MSLKINELENEEELLYDISYQKNITDIFNNGLTENNLFFTIYNLESKESVLKLKELGIETFYCDFNDCYYVNATENNLKILDKIFHSNKLIIFHFETLKSKNSTSYFKYFELVKRKEQEYFSLIYDRLEEIGFNLDTYNDVYIDLKYHSLKRYFKKQKLDPIIFFKENNIELNFIDEEYYFPFSDYNLENIIKLIKNKINPELEKYNKIVDFKNIKIIFIKDKKKIKELKFIIKLKK